MRVTVSLMVPTVALALMAGRALAAEMPKDFRGKWCTDSNTLKDHWVANQWAAYNHPEDADCRDNYSSVEITTDPPPLKWSDLRYVFDIKEDCNGKEAIQA